MTGGSFFDLQRSLKRLDCSDYPQFSVEILLMSTNFRDHVYQLTHETLTPRDTIEWSTKGQVVEECQAKGRPLSECHNFIRVVAKRKNDHLLVCGTHAFSPQCREYEYVEREGGYKSRRDFNGKALTPYHPRANFTYVYSTETNEIFVATVSDFNGNDPLIYKKKIPAGESLRTQKDDLRVLDHPDFVGSFSFNDYIYVFFRERASESSDQQIFSRVGRMCKNDRGGPGTTQDRWSSFLKARLNCSVPADVPFYFNELRELQKIEYKTRGLEKLKDLLLGKSLKILALQAIFTKFVRYLRIIFSGTMQIIIWDEIFGVDFSGYIYKTVSLLEYFVFLRVKRCFQN